MLTVERDHFRRAALEIGQSGENDTLPRDIEARFVQDKADRLSQICFNLFEDINSKSVKCAAKFMNGLEIGSERLLVPAGSHGFRITTKIHPFWNLYLNGIGFAIAAANEANRSERVHSYRLSTDDVSLFDKTRSWRTYKEATIKEPALEQEGTIVVQTDISAFLRTYLSPSAREYHKWSCRQRFNSWRSNRPHTEKTIIWKIFWVTRWRTVCSCSCGGLDDSYRQVILRRGNSLAPFC